MTRRYPAYRDSGVRWLGQIPERWETRRFKTVLQEREERSESGAEVLLSVSAYTGVTPRSENIDDGDFISRAESLEGYKVCYPNDLVMNIMLAWNRAQGVSAYGGIVSPAYAVFELAPVIHPPYLNYLVRSNEYCLYFKAHSAGVIDSRLRLYPDQFGALHCIFPPLPEQTAIAAFLDRETAKIDALVAEQRRLIDLLKEKRQAVISHAVTRGLNPAAKLKPSGVDWLGDVPEGWEVVPVKFQVRSIEQGWSPQCDGFPAGEDEWGVLKVGCVNGGEFRPSENKALPSELTPLPELAVAADDILISRANTRELVGSAALVPVDFPKLMLCDKLYRLRARSEVLEPKYLVLGLSTPQARSVIELAASGASSSMQNIAQGAILDLKLPVPPLNEQRQITGYVAAVKHTFDTLSTTAEAAIALLQERRAALISAAVTGKIDVRDLVPNQTEAA